MKRWLSLNKSFSCGHVYNQKDWSEEQNKKVFGKCFSKYGHGHDYTLEATFELPDSLQTTQSIDQLQQKLDFIYQNLDHKFLNHEVDYFKNKVPTTENIAFYCLEQLKSSNQKLIKIKLIEGKDLWTEIYL